MLGSSIPLIRAGLILPKLTQGTELIPVFYRLVQPGENIPKVKPPQPFQSSKSWIISLLMDQEVQK